MHNLGLIGIVKYDHLRGYKIQKFNKPYQFNWSMTNILPKSSYYIIHPALRRIIRNMNCRYCLHPNILVGDGYKWKDSYEKILHNEKVKLFISYSTKDARFVAKFLNYLQNILDDKNISFDIWIDKWKIRSGEWVQESINTGLRDSDFMIVFLSVDSILSDWVEREWKSKYFEEIAADRIQLFPILIDLKRHEAPEAFSNKNCLEVRKKSSKSITELIEKIGEDIQFFLET